MSPPEFPRPTTTTRLPWKASGILYSWLCRICPLKLWIPEAREGWNYLKYLSYNSAVHNDREILETDTCCLYHYSRTKTCEEQVFWEFAEPKYRSLTTYLVKNTDNCWRDGLRWVMVLVDKPDYLSLISSNQMVEEENRLLQIVLWLYLNTVVWILWIYMNIIKVVQNKPMGNIISNGEKVESISYVWGRA